MNKDKELIQKLKNELYENDSYIGDLNSKLNSEKEKSENLSAKINFVLQKNNSLNESISQLENLFSTEIKKHELEVNILRKSLDNNSNLSKESDYILNDITIKNENCKKEINILKIETINFLHDIENKNSIISDLESTNIKLYENIKELTNKINEIDKCCNEKNNNIEDNLLYIKQKDDLEKIKKSNLYLTEQIEIFRKRNKYLDDEISKMNHEIFDYQTIMNTMRNCQSNYNKKKENNKYCCCIIC